MSTPLPPATPSGPATFSPLLADQAEAIRRVAGEIAEALWSNRQAMGSTYASGLPGAAVFLAYLSRQPGFEGWRERSYDLLEMALADVRPNPAPSLYAGYLGLAWTIEHLTGPAFGGDGEDWNDEVDEVLLETLEGPGWDRHFDVVAGLAGIGVYGLERLPRETGCRILERVLEKLEVMSCMEAQGRSWPTPLGRMPPWAKELSPEGVWDMGVAHGLFSVLPVLAAIEAAGVGNGKARRLYEEGMAWTTTRVQDPADGCHFPNWIPRVPERRTELKMRIAWCYGDLGASVALLAAGRRLGRHDDLALALRMARFAAARPLSEACVFDACLCHGSAGNGHLFNRLYQATGDPVFRAAAETYLRDALLKRRPGEGFAGYSHYAPEPARTGRAPDDPVHYLPEPGLLEGAAGIGLALLAALGGPEPAWDRTLLVS